MESSECLLFDYLNDFPLNLSDFTTYSQILVNFFMPIIFLQKLYFHKKKIFCSIIFSWSIFQIIWTCLTNLESSECLLLAYLNDLSLNITYFTWYLQILVNVFELLFFYKNCIFTKKFFLLNHIFWEYFLDYKDLPYQFGILRMSTFCWSQWFNTSSTRICIVHTNVSKLFFRTDLSCQIYWKTFQILDFK